MAETITLKGTCGPTYDKERMSRRGNYLFVCNEQNGLRVFYLPDKTLNASYKFAATYTPDPMAFVEDIAIAGIYGFLLWWKYDPEWNRDRYLSVLDVSNPLSISPISTLDMGVGFIRCVVKDREYLFITADDYIRVIDVSTPASPTEVGSVQLSNHGYGMTF